MPRESAHLFEQFMASLQGLAWIKDLDGRYVFVNEAAARAFQRPLAEIHGKTDDELFPPETAAQFRANDRRALESKAALEAVETLRHPDGVLHHSLVSKFPIFGDEGEVRGIGGMAIDITERVNFEQALRDTDRRKDEFLATLAHELRNPLAPIRNAVQILRMANASRENQARARDLIDRQVLHMVRLIDELLDVSRISLGRLQIRTETADLGAVLQAAIETGRPAIEAAGHDLEVELPPEPVSVVADVTRLAQVFANLLNNAAKYTEPGGHVWLAAERRGDEIAVSVRDTGIGIRAEYLGRLFEMFSQVAPPIERAQGGLGIGLALARGLVELHGGRIEARSAGPGKGSEFIVHLPLAPSSIPAPKPAEVQATQPARVRRRVLVVDDNADNVESLTLMLAELGHEVRTALDGLEGVQAAAVFRPQVVLLDIGMPKMNGYEVARHIRMQPWGRDIKLIAMTGWGQEGDRRRSQDAGFDRHLVKPVDPVALAQLLDQRA